MELDNLMKIATEKKLELREMDNWCYMIFNKHTNDFERYWSLDHEFDSGLIFTIEEAENYIINF